MSEENVEIVRAGLEAFRRGDVQEALERVHPEIVSMRTDPDGAVYRGHDGLLELIADWAEGFDEWTYRSEEFIDAGDHVVVRLHQWGRGKGSGAPVESEIWLTYAIADRMITRIGVYPDSEQAFAAAEVTDSSAARPSQPRAPRA
jgi:ketosteroid isomerase-like protein